MSYDKALRRWLLIALIVVGLCATGIFYESYLDKQKRQEELELAWEQLEPGIAPWVWWDIVGNNLVDGGPYVTLSVATAGVTIDDNTFYGFDGADTATWVFSLEDLNPITGAYVVEIAAAKEKISREWVGSLVIRIMNGYDAGGFLVAREITIEELKKIGIEIE